MNFTSSFFDNIRDKTTNPFFGTLIFVWLVRNWDLIYTLFNFDNDCDLQDKKEFIRNYYGDKIIWQEIVFNIVIAFGLMILGYVLIIISRLVVNVTDHNIIPWMNNKTVSKLVVNKDRFETVKKTRDEYFTKIQDYEEQVITLEQKNSISKKQNIENRQKIRELNESINKLNSNIEEFHAGASYLKNNLEENEKTLALKDNVIKRYSSANEKLIEDIDGFNNLILSYLKDEVDVHFLVPYDQLKIPKVIKEAYFSLSRESRKIINLDLMFFGIASHLRDEDVEKLSFDIDLMQSYFKIGLVKIKKGVEDKNVDYNMIESLELTVIGSLVLDTKDVYNSLKNDGVI